MLDEVDTTKFEDSDGIETYYCPNCRANLRFDIRAQSLKCDFCGTEVGVESNGTVDEYDFSNLELLEKQSNWNTEAIAFQCESCGAELITESHETTARCPYCDSSHIIQHQQFSGMRPEGVIPFKITETGASNLFKQWVKEQWLAPNDFKKIPLNMEFSGIYIPYWTYDANARSEYHGQGGNDCGKSTIWYKVSGHVSYNFNDVLVCASKGLDSYMLNNIAPFNTTRSVSYQSEYLSGFKAERYVIDAKEGYREAKQQMDDFLEKLAIHQIKEDYDSARVDSLSPVYSHIMFKHILLPVWVMTYSYNNKVYQCLINGETGKIDGKSPISPLKMATVIILTVGFLYFLYSLVNAT